MENDQDIIYRQTAEEFCAGESETGYQNTDECPNTVCGYFYKGISDHDADAPQQLPTDGYRIEDESAFHGLPFHCLSQKPGRPCQISLPHLHEYIEILYCEYGEFRVTADGGDNKLCPGEMMLINSHEVHCTACTRVPASMRVIKFSPDLLGYGAKSAFEYRYMLPFTLENTRMKRLFSRETLKGSGVDRLTKGILEEYTAQRYGYELAVQGDICRLFVWILRRWRNEGADLDFSHKLGENTLLRLKELFEYIENNLQEDITLETGAGMCGFSPSHFSRVFKQAAGRNFTDYLNSRRINSAKRLLATSRLNITEIAMECGFSSTSYFIKKFRDVTGVSPKKYREVIS